MISKTKAVDKMTKDLRKVLLTLKPGMESCREGLTKIWNRHNAFECIQGAMDQGGRSDSESSWARQYLPSGIEKQITFILGSVLI